MTKKTNDSNTNVTVKTGDKVQVHYTGKFNDGIVFDSSEGRTPLAFEVGSGQVIPGFDKALVGMKKEESKQIIIPSAEAYGPERKEMVVTFERKQLPAKPEPEVGMMLLLRDPQGHQLPARIVKVEKEMVTLDLNHPLAGKDLTFELKVVGINEASDPSGDSDCACGEEKEESGCCGGCGDDCECK